MSGEQTIIIIGSIVYVSVRSRSRMSEDKDKDKEVSTSSCASCGIAEGNDVKLKECDGCDLVRYCSDECQGDHRAEHNEKCKKRAAELRDELLFRQPESTHDGDCPICFLPLPLEALNVLMPCCSKVVCQGCDLVDVMRRKETRHNTCPFCRDSTDITTEEQCDKLIMKRIEANDSVAMFREGEVQHKKANLVSAFECYTKAAELGNAYAHFRLARMYNKGHGVEKDLGKEIYHTEEAAIGGHPDARFNLGAHEWNKYNPERAVKHWIIAANHGHDNSIKKLMDAFKLGFVEKDVLAAALRAHQAAVDATKSPQREAAEEYRRKL